MQLSWLALHETACLRCNVCRNSSKWLLDRIQLTWRYALGSTVDQLQRAHCAASDLASSCSVIRSTQRPTWKQQGGNRIHISSDTADLLMAAGKGHRLRMRHDKVAAKGKGELTTYWLDLRGESGQSTMSGTSSESYDGATHIEHSPADKGKIMSAIQSTEDHHDAMPHKIMNDKINRLIDWNIARREAAGVRAESASRMEELEQEKMYRDTTVLDEVIDIITLPQFDPSVAHRQKSADRIELGEKVMTQLRDFVQTIAAMYNENSFHNF